MGKSKFIDADIRGFFDAIDHGWLMKFLEHRIGDKTISPLLANVYLHYGRSAPRASPGWAE